MRCIYKYLKPCIVEKKQFCVEHNKCAYHCPAPRAHLHIWLGGDIHLKFAKEDFPNPVFSLEGMRSDYVPPLTQKWAFKDVDFLFSKDSKRGFYRHAEIPSPDALSGYYESHYYGPLRRAPWGENAEQQQRDLIAQLEKLAVEER